MPERYRIGNVEIAVAIDTEGAMETTRFFPHIANEAWEPYRHLLTGSGRIRARIVSFAVRSRGKTILVDTGIGHWDLPGYGNGHLLDSLAALDLAPEAVDYVLATHLHIDHTGWNTRPSPKGPVPTFARACYLFQQADWEYFTASDARLTPDARQQVVNSVLPLKDTGLMDLIDSEFAVTEEVTLLHAPGHTPGQVCVVIQSAGEAAIIIGDVCHHPAQLTETDWSPVADIDPALSARTRKAVVERAKQLQALVAGAHFNEPAFGHLIEIEGRTLWRGVDVPHP
jgi:glyoxylase-like metal-dependent hydrolase (beta-lactamase superfamily II)